jgi:uncharacterized protein HemX
MDPNNSQPIGTQPMQPPVMGNVVQQPVTPPAAQPVAPTTPPPAPVQPAIPTPIVTETEPVAQEVSGGHKKGTLLLLLLLLLVIGIGAYVLYTKNVFNAAQEAPKNTTMAVPTVIVATPTPATVEQINVEDPTTDLNAIDKDAQGL